MHLALGGISLKLAKGEGRADIGKLVALHIPAEDILAHVASITMPDLFPVVL